MKKTFLITILSSFFLSLAAQSPQVPEVMHHLHYQDGKLTARINDTLIFTELSRPAGLSTHNFPAQVTGVAQGFLLDFRRPSLTGIVTIGLIDYEGSRYPLPVYRSHTFPILGGKAAVNMDVVRGHYDMTGWEESGRGVLG